MGYADICARMLVKSHPFSATLVIVKQAACNICLIYGTLIILFSNRQLVYSRILSYNSHITLQDNLAVYKSFSKVFLQPVMFPYQSHFMNNRLARQALCAFAFATLIETLPNCS